MCFEDLVEKINSRKTSTGWHSQLLENESNLRDIPMATLFMEKALKLGRPVKVPATCISMTLEEGVFIFNDNSKTSISVNLIC